MNFPDNYFDDEVRDGFYVPGIMKRAWAAQLEVLEDVDKLCKKHGIRWFADCGTLLGAVRHGGFVPWDDDLDICMLREDYNRFNQIAVKELADNYCILNVACGMDTDDFLTRVANSKAICFKREHLNKYHEFPYSAGIDIFPLDYIAPDEEAENFRKEIGKIVSTVINDINEGNQSQEIILQEILQIEELTNVKFDRNRPIKRQLGALLDNIFSLYTAEEATEVALMPYWFRNDNHKYKLEYFKDTVLLPFENIQVSAPAMYDAVLRIEYGDYMRLVRNSGVHNYPYFRTQEEQLEGLLGGKLHYRYYFSEEDLQVREGAKCSLRENVKIQAKDILEDIRRIHLKSDSALECGDNMAVPPLLVKCQNQALFIGNLIEKLQGEECEAVRLLERYCENIYKVYELLSTENNEAAVRLWKDTAGLFEEIVDCVYRSVINRREVVFLPYKASMWDSFDGLWREAVEAGDCDVYVIPIPYFYKNADGRAKEECYEGEKFPPYVRIMDYRQYNFEVRRPDIIYTQNPYDGCNNVLSVYPFFYSKNMRQYTDKLVYVQPFMVDEFTADEERAVLNAENYIVCPGVVFADKVITQSEAMKKTYIELLVKAAGDETRDIWEEKIDGSGLPRTRETAQAKKERILSELPENWKDLIYRPDGTRKKIVLYNNSVSALLQYKERILDKIGRALATFKENESDIVLLWMENSLIRPTIEHSHPELWQEYSKLVDKYAGENWGIYDDTAELERAVAISDAYYGDADRIMQRCRRAKMPIMVENVEI